MDPDGTDIWQVTHDVGGYEIQSWSPNGEKILYEYISNGHRDLFVINADGTGKRRLTSVRSSAEDLNRVHNVLWLP
jgi:Tol biopolymer transport system component